MKFLFLLIHLQFEQLQCLRLHFPTEQLYLTCDLLTKSTAFGVLSRNQWAKILVKSQSRSTSTNQFQCCRKQQNAWNIHNFWIKQITNKIPWSDSHMSQLSLYLSFQVLKEENKSLLTPCLEKPTSFWLRTSDLCLSKSAITLQSVLCVGTITILRSMLILKLQAALKRCL